VFIKNGEHTLWTFSSQWCSWLKSLILLWSLFEFIYDLLGKWLKLRFGCIYYDMCFGDMGNTVLKYMFLETFDINMRSIWIWILLAIYKVEWLKWRFDCMYFHSSFDMLWNMVWNMRFWKDSILICTQFGFGFTHDDK